jgi:hypothetical protein
LTTTTTTTSALMNRKIHKHSCCEERRSGFQLKAVVVAPLLTIHSIRSEKEKWHGGEQEEQQ